MNLLAQERKKRNWSQEFAAAKFVKIFEEHGGRMALSYAMRILSNLENGHIQPNEAIRRALAQLYEIPESSIEAEYARAAIDGTDFFSAIAKRCKEGHKVLIATVNGGGFREMRDDDPIRQSILEALENGAQLAVFMPYPSADKLPAEATTPQYQYLTNLYAMVRLEALARCGSYRDSLSSTFKQNVQAFEPKTTGQMAMLPAPFDHRVVLVIGKDADGKIDYSLYSWIENTTGEEAFYRLGTFVATNLERQRRTWETYFGWPVAEWKTKNTTTETDSVFWQRVPDEHLH